MQLFLEFRIGDLGNVHIAEILPVARGILVHRGFKCRGNAHIIDNQTAFFIFENAIDTGDCLHQIVAMHWLIDIHRCQRGHIKARQPHIHDDGNFHGIVVIFEFARQFILMRLCADNLAPFLWVIVAAGHDHANLFLPVRTQFQNPLINLHGDRAAVGNDHGLARQKIGAVFLVMLDNVPAKRVDGGICAQHAFHLPQHFLALFDGCWVGLIFQQGIGFVNLFECLLI